MKTRSFKTDIRFAFILTIALFAILVASFGYYIIKHDIIERAQRQVRLDLKVARWFYDSEAEKIRLAFNLVSPKDDIEALRREIGLDYLYVIKKQDKKSVKSEIVLSAFEGRPSAGTRLIDSQELQAMGRSLSERSVIDIRPTQKARPTDRKVSESAMAVGYAKPVFDAKGEVESVMYGGKIINRDFELVDRIGEFVFEGRLYGKKPLGTVTIFLDDVRVATNVLDSKGERALGTRVSETVYKKVVEEGRLWLDRAFVVTDWYLTAYEPIRNIKGDVIGILYVGTLERPFLDLQRNIFLGFLGIVFLASVLAAFLSVVLGNKIWRPLSELSVATGRISGGELDYRIQTKDMRVRELNALAESFNDMARKLRERQKSYLDLIGFVAHELKGILSSTILNAYTVRDGFLGMVNFKQRRTLDSVVRNLDYFASTVRNFLDLSRIEKGELKVQKKEVLLREDIFDNALDDFSKQADEKHLKMVDRIPAGIKARGDRDLLLIVANNLIGNAVKYAPEGASVVLSLRDDASTRMSVEVYNDGVPIPQDQKERLFEKFSRLETAESKKARGTGLGLFIAKEIIGSHGGRIWVETREKGNAFIFEVERGNESW